MSRHAFIVLATFAIPFLPTLADDPPRFDHGPWTAVLQQFVDDRGFVNYTALAENREALDPYLAALATSGPRSTPQRFPTDADRLAFYINAYNALVFGGVLDRGPEASSVWTGLISGFNFFSRTKFTLDGNKTNLKSLEDDFIRREFRDPRIHAALNCASRGCPRLPREAFLPQTLDEQLDAAMREFVGSPRHVDYDARRRRLRLSKIFRWFEKDFLDEMRRRGVADPRLVDYVNLYLADGRAVPRDVRISFLDYDKRINAQLPPT